MENNIGNICQTIIVRALKIWMLQSNKKLLYCERKNNGLVTQWVIWVSRFRFFPIIKGLLRLLVGLKQLHIFIGCLQAASCFTSPHVWLADCSVNDQGDLKVVEGLCQILGCCTYDRSVMLLKCTSKGSLNKRCFLDSHCRKRKKKKVLGLKGANYVVFLSKISFLYQDEKECDNKYTRLF